jgi:putative ABC transport system substrate-binding protein
MLGAPLLSRANAPAGVRRIGFLVPSSTPLFKGFLEAFTQGLRELGYVEGKNFVIEQRSAEGENSRLPALAAELVALKVAVIVAAGGTPSILVAKNATKTIPIVFPTSGDPVVQGLVASFARPGGNLTGLFLQGPDSVGKRLELLKQIVPHAKRIAVLTNPNNSGALPFLNEAQTAAGVLGVELLVIDARAPADFDGAFAELGRRQADGLVIFEDAMLLAESSRLATLAAKRKLPTMGGSELVTAAGGLASYGPNRNEMYRRASAFVDRILRGAKPADLPVGMPLKYDLVINRRTAKALGIVIPQSILLRASQAID